MMQAPSTFKQVRLVALILFGIALASRLVLWLVGSQSGVFRLTPPGTLVNLGDFYFVYVKQLSYLAQGYIPYRDIPYSSTPLFIYALYPFYLLGGASAASIPIIVSDALSSVFVFLIARRIARERVAIAAGLAYALSPIALFFEGYLWLNSEPVLLFVLVGIYSLQLGKPSVSALALGLAVLFNQDALFVLPPVLVFYVAKRRAGDLRSLLLLVLTVAVGSLPFLLAFPIQYVKSVSYGLLGSFSQTLQLNPVSSLTGPAVYPANQVSCYFAVHLAKMIGTCTSFVDGRIVTSWTQGLNPIGYLSVFSDLLGPLVIASLAVLLLPAVFVARKWQNFYLLASAYSSIVFLALFSFEVHPVYRYYLLIAYALLLCCSTNWRTISVPILSMILSVFTPEGNFQMILILGALLALIALQDSSTNGNWRASAIPAAGTPGRGDQLQDDETAFAGFVECQAGEAGPHREMEHDSQDENRGGGYRKVGEVCQHGDDVVRHEFVEDRLHNVLLKSDAICP